MASGQIECPLCQKKFRRPEHMKRHKLSHVTEKPFECEKCKRGFNRSDALQRHQLTHTQQGPNLLQRKARACLNCATARVRCTAESPSCARCSSKSLDCAYPDAKRSAGSSDSTTERDDPTSELATASDQPAPETMLTNGCEMMYTQVRSPQSATIPSRHPINYPGTGAENRIDSPNAISTQGYGAGGSDLALGNSERAQVALHPPTAIDHVSAIQVNTQIPSGPYGYDHEGFGPQSASAFGGFEFESAGISSLNWLPMETGLVYQDASPVDIHTHSWTPQFNAFTSASGTFQQNNPAPLVTNYPSVPTPSSNDIQRHDHASPLEGDRSSHAPSSGQETVASGEFYLDGDGARLPRVKRRRLLSKTTVEQSTARLSLEIAHPETLLSASARDHPSNATYTMDEPTHRVLYTVFEEVCIHASAGAPPYDSSAFPGRELFNCLIDLYLENFNTILPFLHVGTLKDSDPHYILVASMAAVGSHYAEQVDSMFVHSLHEYVRRAINVLTEVGASQDLSPTEMAQAKILNVVGMVYCGDKHLRSSALGMRGELAAYYLNTEDQLDLPTTLSTNDAVYDLGNEWRHWIEKESRIRTAYCIWLLDTQWAFQFGERPFLALDDADKPLPCHDKLWEAKTVADWQHLSKKPLSSRSLLEALNDMYVEKRLHHHTGEFSRILLIHGLFRRNWEIEAYLRQPFARWEPSAHHQGRQSTPSSRPIWMPADQTYSRWRNATCDCLDLLHWSANATIGRQSGMEHPTVLHLHLARVVLLTPHKIIRKIAQANQTHDSPSDPDMRSERHIVQLWATQDQYKARLAMIHAGVIFWHVRRYSSNAFYEPSAVYLATLALWAYSMFADRRKPSQATTSTGQTHAAASPFPQTPNEGVAIRGSADREEGDEELPLINLDRPTDDELVQMFVKHGGSMHALVTGVGDIHGESGPVRILREGRKLLSTLDCWGIGRQLIGELDAMLDDRV